MQRLADVPRSSVSDWKNVRMGQKTPGFKIRAILDQRRQKLYVLYLAHLRGLLYASRGVFSRSGHLMTQPVRVQVMTQKIGVRRPVSVSCGFPDQPAAHVEPSICQTCSQENRRYPTVPRYETEARFVMVWQRDGGPTARIIRTTEIHGTCCDQHRTQKSVGLI